MTHFVIRSMSTTDFRPGVPPVPYHIYLLPPERRQGAWWSKSLPDAQRFASTEEAQAVIDNGPASLARSEIVPVDASHLPPYWERQR